jgi:hypothetical protein
MLRLTTSAAPSTMLTLSGGGAECAYGAGSAPHRRGALGKGIPVQQQRVRSVRLFYGGFRVISVSGASGE